MPEQQVLWTALPRRASATELELDIFVSPRLGINSSQDRHTLAEFPDFEHWPKTLQQRLSFSVEFADGSTEPAQIVAPTPSLNPNAWDHIFPGTTFVRPWSFRDLSETPIYSTPVRFVTAYLRDLYQEVGRAHPTAPPKRGDLDRMRSDLGRITDVRVHEERKPPPWHDRQLPEPTPEPPPRPKPAPEGCLAVLCRLLAPLAWLLRPVRIKLGLPPLCKPTTQPPPDPTRPKTEIPRAIHPSPYRARSPIPPADLPKRDRLEQQMAMHKVVAPMPKVGNMKLALGQRDVGFDFTRVLRFYERPEMEPPPGGWPPPRLPEFDFHQTLAAFGDYQAMLRALGLLVRLRVPRPAVSPTSVRVIPAWNGATRASDVSPRTRCVADTTRFAAAQRGGFDLAQGALDLAQAGDRLATDTPAFDLVQVDSDGAALKAILYAASLERALQLALDGVLALELEQPEPTPALRSGGLALVRPDRAAQVHGKLVDAALQKTATPAATPDQPASLANDLFAEDLVRGYQVHVSDDAGATWRSLCSRVGRYRLVDDAGGTAPESIPDVTDEGYVKSTSATSNGGPGNPLYVHEVLARWTGWSLCVPRPGKTLEPATLANPRDPYEQPEVPKSDPALVSSRFAVRFDPAPGSLPRLRFGKKFRIRALCVDLAGEPLEQPSAATPSSDDVTYRRFEPAAPPAPLPLRHFTPGESLERIVVRSDIDRDSATWDAEEMSGTPVDARARRTRHVFPPKTSEEMVELHGKLDKPPFQAFGPGADPDAAYRVALREQGTFRDEHIFDVDTVDVGNPVATVPFGSPKQIDSYVINRTDSTLPTPYLPDPAVAGVALRGVPGLVDHVAGDLLPIHQIAADDSAAPTEPLLQIPFTGSWPNIEPWRLRAAETTAPAAPPHWDKAARMLTVYLRKGEQREVRYSSYLATGELDHHGVWDWLDDHTPNSPLREQAEAGAHWMISPARTLALVHAVERPLSSAYFTSLAASRTAAQTTADLSGALSLDAATTSRIDVIGRWQEWRDPIDGNDFDEREAVACDFVVHDWGNTPNFPPPPAKPGDVVQARHEFGDTKHRWVDYAIRATTSFREYFDPATAPERLTRESTAAEIKRVSVKSTARPDPPRVLYAVPTFGWDGGSPSPNWTTHTSNRRGGALRVYLEPPWYSSGEGELLGVVLPGSSPDLPEDQRSRYGADPIWEGSDNNTTTDLLSAHFLNRVDEDPDVTLPAKQPGDPEPTVTVVAFKPEWDGGRGLWFCDIELDIAKLRWPYWPFVRFAFVRYQHESIGRSFKASAVAIGEFAQLAPARLLSLSWQGNSTLDVTLSGRGPSGGQTPRVAFRIQTTAAALPDELDWQYDSGDPTTVDSQSFNALTTGVPAANGDVVWGKTLNLPTPRHSKPMRIEVAEYEGLDADPEFGARIPRLTYAAHVSLA
jgi:hypothetical protein